MFMTGSTWSRERPDQLRIDQMARLLLRDAELALLIIVSPGAGHHVAVDFSINGVMNGSAPIAFSIKFHGDGTRLRFE